MYVFTPLCVYMSIQSLQCVFDGNCSIDVRSRRLCSACRLKKCLDMGMKRQLILGKIYIMSRGTVHHLTFVKYNIFGKNIS